MRRRAAALLSLLAIGWSAAAFAYRPFDGTDAAVAAPGDVEIELGPAGFLRQGTERTLIAPAATINYGFAGGWETVLEGQVDHGLSAAGRRTALVGNAASLKHVLRQGSLQDQPGPSIATEFGLLLPGVNDEPGIGGSVAGILSQQWPFLTVHLNLAAAVTRQQHGDVFIGAIVEGPRDWTVRPVAEIFHERDFGRLTTDSALVGAIWQIADDLSVDTGLRHAHVNNRSLDEVRVGLTFGFGLRR